MPYNPQELKENRDELLRYSEKITKLCDTWSDENSKEELEREEKETALIFKASKEAQQNQTKHNQRIEKLLDGINGVKWNEVALLNCRVRVES